MLAVMVGEIKMSMAVLVLIEKTLRKNFAKSLKHIQGVNCVVNMYSVWSLPELYKICKYFNKNVYFSPCFLPEYLNPQRLPPEEKHKLRELL